MKSVVVCGSKKYKANMSVFCSELEKLGVLVFEPNFSEIPIGEGDTFDSEFVTKVIFKGLTFEHFDWIRKADICFVYNEDDYAGVSVSMEMAYASALGKPVFALSAKTGDPCRDALIDKVFPDAQSLAKVL